MEYIHIYIKTQNDTTLYASYSQNIINYITNNYPATTDNFNLISIDSSNIDVRHVQYLNNWRSGRNKTGNYIFYSENDPPSQNRALSFFNGANYNCNLYTGILPSQIILTNGEVFESKTKTIIDSNDKSTYLDEFYGDEDNDRNIQKIIIGNMVTEIVNNCEFVTENDLDEIRFQQNAIITKIGDYAFFISNENYWNYHILSITIPSSINYIGKNAFTNCKGLTDIYFDHYSNSDISLGSGALDTYNTNTIFHVYSTEINLINNIQTNYKNEYYVYKPLGEGLPDVTNLYYGLLFRDISSSTIISKNENGIIQDLIFNGVIINQLDIYSLINPENSDILGPVQSFITRVIIGQPVIKITAGAFAFNDISGTLTFRSGSYLKIIERYAFGSSSFTSIRLPSSIEIIQDNAFDGCDKLSAIYFDHNDKLTITNRSFRGVHNSCKFYIFPNNQYLITQILNYIEGNLNNLNNYKIKFRDINDLITDLNDG